MSNTNITCSDTAISHALCKDRVGVYDNFKGGRQSTGGVGTLMLDKNAFQRTALSMEWHRDNNELDEEVEEVSIRKGIVNRKKKFINSIPSPDYDSGELPSSCNSFLFRWKRCSQRERKRNYYFFYSNIGLLIESNVMIKCPLNSLIIFM